MRSVKFIVAAGAASLLSSMASAADMAIAPPPMGYAPPPVADFGGWYLRGDIGFSNQRVDSIRNTNPALYAATDSFQETTGFDTGGIYQLGAGYQFNHWFRVDVTGEYRGSTNFHGLDVLSYPDGRWPDRLRSRQLQRQQVRMAVPRQRLCRPRHLVVHHALHRRRHRHRAGADCELHRFGVATLFPAGSGVGPSLVSAQTGSQWNFAWALHAGLAYKVNPNMTVELGYSYVNLGNGTTGVGQHLRSLAPVATSSSSTTSPRRT